MTHKYLSFLAALVFFVTISACNSVYKKHYSSGYTLLKHKNNTSAKVAANQKSLQEKTVQIIEKDIAEAKKEEQQKAEKSYQTYHKSLNKIENNVPGKLLSGINKLTLKKIDALKADTIYRKVPPKSGNQNSSVEVQDKAQMAMIFGIVSLASFFLVWILSLIPAIIALVMAKKANAMAKLNGDELPKEANLAKILAWVSIGLNILSFLIILLYLILVIILFASI